MAINIPDLIAEIYTYESQAKWPPNKRMFQKALVTLGEPDKWGVGIMTSSDAWAKRAKENRQRGKEKWKRIAEGLEQIGAAKKEIAKTKKPNTDYAYGETVKANALEDHITFGPEDITALQEGKTKFKTYGGIELDMSVFIPYFKQDANSPRTKSTYERENANLRKTIAQKDREINGLLAQAAGEYCPECANTRNRYETMIQQQASTITQLEAKRDMLQKKVNDLVASFQEVRSQNSPAGKTAGQIQKLKDQLSIALNNYDNAKNEIDRLIAENIELRNDITELESQDVTETEAENHRLRETVHELKNKLAGKGSISFQDAIAGLASGRVLEPHIGTMPKLTKQDVSDLKLFINAWEQALGLLPRDYVYGMKNKESKIVKRYNIKIDDYGTPSCKDINTLNLAYAIQYMDGATSHAYQEIQAACRMAKILLTGERS